MKLGNTSLDIVVKQQGSHYVVSGNDAPLLHAKMHSLPSASQDLLVGEMTDGTFTLEKKTSGIQKKAASG